MRTQGRAEAGFTLVEVMIALFIFSLISVGATTALAQATQAKASVTQKLDRIAEIEAARALLSADIAALDLAPVRDAYGGNALYTFEAGTDVLLRFTRSGRTNPGGLDARGDRQRVEWVLDGDDFIRRTLTTANPAPQTESIDRVLFGGVDAADLELLSTRNGNAIRTPFVQLRPGQVPEFDRLALKVDLGDAGNLNFVFGISP